jgi:SAM-dependent methyltransferase
MNPAEFGGLERAERELWWFRGMQRILFAMLDPLAASREVTRVLEAGSGTGHMARMLAQRYGWQMFPVDLAWEGISRTGESRMVFPAQADIAVCPFRGAAFDAVLSLDVLVHFVRGSEALALKEFARVLRPGGLLLLRVAALDVLRSRHSQFAGERQRFTRQRLIHAARDCGFRVLRCSYANSLLLPVALARFRLWEPLMLSVMRRAPASGTGPVPAWLDRTLFLPLAIEAGLLSHGVNLPLGQSLILIAERANDRN